MSDGKCNAKFELANGEVVTPCHLEDGHSGQHEGYCLGSKITWPQGFMSEWELNHIGEDNE